MRGRMFGQLAVAFIGAAPIGAVDAGFLAEAIGVRATLIAVAALCIAIARVSVAHPRWKNLNDLTRSEVASN